MNLRLEMTWGQNQASEAGKTASKFQNLASIRHTPLGRSVSISPQNHQKLFKNAKVYFNFLNEILETL